MKLPFLRHKQKEDKATEPKQQKKVVSSPDQQRIGRESDYQKRLEISRSERRSYGAK